jgi:hypothetical protein
MIAKVRLFPLTASSKYNKIYNSSSEELLNSKNNYKNLPDDEHKLNRLKIYLKNLNRTSKQNEEESTKNEMKNNPIIENLTNEQIINNNEDSKEYISKLNRFKIMNNIENEENDDIYDKYFKNFLILYLNNLQLFERFFKFESNRPTIDELYFDKLNKLSNE